MPLAGQLLHQRPVHLGPLVLETTPLKPPTPVADRDRQDCYLERKPRARGPGHFCLTLHVAMQLGLYLPGLAALSGVQSLRILESHELLPPHLPMTPASIHGERQIEQLAESGGLAVVT